MLLLVSSSTAIWISGAASTGPAAGGAAIRGGGAGVSRATTGALGPGT